LELNSVQRIIAIRDFLSTFRLNDDGQSSGSAKTIDAFAPGFGSQKASDFDLVSFLIF
jgi:hypothetical protein